jgi:hypothetical protein
VCDVGGQLRKQLAQILGHPLLLTEDVAGELCRLLVPHRRGERVDHGVGGDLLGLGVVFRPCVVEHLPLLA